MKHTHHHHNHSLHAFCLATVVYNILVVIAEVVLQLLLTSHDAHDILTFEIRVQLFHFVGIIALGVLQWWIMHKIKKQTAGKFAGVSIAMLVVHMLVLHLLPRIWGISIQEHHGDELKEFIILGAIVIFISILFWKREKWLNKFNLKNKWVRKLPL